MLKNSKLQLLEACIVFPVTKTLFVVIFCDVQHILADDSWKRKDNVTPLDLPHLRENLLRMFKISSAHLGSVSFIQDKSCLEGVELQSKTI